MWFFKENIQEKYNKKRFYGAYIHDLRRYYEIPQKDLAKTLHISAPALSKMESGQQNMDYSMFHQCIDYFKKLDPDYDFNENVSKLSEAEQWIDFCLKEFINLSYFDKTDRIKKYLDNQDNKNSIAYFHYKMIESFYEMFNGKGTMEQIRVILEINYFLSPDYLAILYDLYGIIEDTKNIEIIQHQIKLLQKSRALAQQSNQSDLLGLVEYHLAYRFNNCHNYYSALKIIEQAETNLQKSGSYRRLVTVQMHKANLYLKLKIYSRANLIYSNLLSRKDQIQNNLVETSLYDNIAWCLFMQEKDEQALEYAKQALSLGSTFPDIYIVLAFSNYRLHQFDLARQFAIEFLEKNFEEERAVLIGLFMKLVLAVLDQEPDIASLASQITSLLPDFRAVELEIPFYSLLTDYYKSQNDFSRALDAQDKLVSYLKFNFNFH